MSSKPDFSAGLLQRRCHSALRKVIAHGANNYDRMRHLPRLLPRVPFPKQANSLSETRQIVRYLLKAMRLEKNLGLAGHWSYDLNKHIGLRQALQAELRLLRQLTANMD